MYPAAIFSCRAEPDSTWITTDADLDVYIIMLALAGRDCRTQLQRIPAVTGLKVSSVGK